MDVISSLRVGGIAFSPDAEAEEEETRLSRGGFGFSAEESRKLSRDIRVSLFGAQIYKKNNKEHVVVVCIYIERGHQ